MPRTEMHLKANPSDDTHSEPSLLPAPRMATPARADRITVETLLQWAREGRIRIPSFQRPLRWETQDRRDLLDSMERGYPVGTLLFWKRSASASDLGKLLPGVKEPAKDGDLYLVVDGQQRIVTLWDALGRTPEPGEPVMVFEYKGDIFRLRRKPSAEQFDMLDAHPALPLHIALDATALSEWVPASLPREVRRRYFEVGRRLREYPLPIYVVEGDDPDVLRHVFDRVNSTGKALTRDDVFDGLVGSRIVKDQHSGLELVNEQLRDLGFGSLDRMSILKTFETLRGEKVGHSNPRQMKLEQAETDLNRTAFALRKAILFLREQAKIAHVAVLPYELPLVVLARYFSLFDRPSERNIILLCRWFWRGSIAGKFTGASGSIQRYLDDIQEDNEDASVQALLKRIDLRKRSELGEKAFSIANARDKIRVCALLSRYPRDLETGDKLDAGELFKDDLATVLRTIVSPNPAELGKSFANRLLHPPSRQSPYRLITETLDEGALLSHGINIEAQRALQQDNTKTFLEKREAILKRWVEEFCDRQAEWERDNAPSILAISTRGRKP